MSALTLAIGHGHTELANLLLDMGAKCEVGFIYIYVWI
jgi:ankyrin repeat protein